MEHMQKKERFAKHKSEKISILKIYKELKFNNNKNNSKWAKT